MRARPRRLISTSLLAWWAISAVPAVVGHAASPIEAPAAPTTTAAAATTTSPAPTTTGVTTTTEAGPPPRSSQRVATDVDTEKIRPTSLPLRKMAIVTAVVIAGLAIAGSVYGRLRSRGPRPNKPGPATVGESASAAITDGPPTEPPSVTIPPPTPLPPPDASPLPPPEPVTAWAPPTPPAESEV